MPPASHLTPREGHLFRHAQANYGITRTRWLPSYRNRGRADCGALQWPLWQSCGGGQARERNDSRAITRDQAPATT